MQALRPSKTRGPRDLLDPFDQYDPVSHDLCRDPPATKNRTRWFIHVQ